MTKQHFIYFANYIKHAPLTRDEKQKLAHMVIAAGTTFNDLFSAHKFLKAAGLEPKS